MKYNLPVFSIFRKKRLLKFSSISFGIIIIGYIFIYSLSNGVKELYENKQLEYIENLFLNILSNKNYSDIKSDVSRVNSIVEIYPIVEINIDEYSLVYHDNRLISILDGEQITNRNELLISNYNSKYKLGDKLKIRGEIFTIVGIYDSLEYQFATVGDVSSDLLYCSYDFYMDNIDLKDVYSAMILIDSYDNLEYTYEQLSEYTIGSSSKGADVLERLLSFQQNISVLKKVFELFSFFLIMIVMAVIVHDNSNDIALFKSFGYSNFQLSKILIEQVLLLFLFNFLTSIVITCSIFLILKALNVSILIFSISNIIKCFLLFIISIFINLIVSFTVIKKINIVKTLKSI